MNTRYLSVFCASVLMMAISTGCQQARQGLASTLPGSKKAREEAHMKFTSARLKERNGDYRGALKLYEQLELSSSQPKALDHRLAITHMNLSNVSEAESYFKKALQQNPENSELLADYGYSQYLRGNHDEAQKYLHQALELSPDLKRAKMNLALSLGMSGDLQQSFLTFREVVGEAEAHSNLAYVHIQRGEGELAIKRYSKALSIDPKLNSAGQAMVQLAQLRQRQLPTNTKEAETQIAQSSPQPDTKKPLPVETVSIRHAKEPVKKQVVQTAGVSALDSEKHAPFEPSAEKQNPFASTPHAARESETAPTPQGRAPFLPDDFFAEGSAAVNPSVSYPEAHEVQQVEFQEPHETPNNAQQAAADSVISMGAENPFAHTESGETVPGDDEPVLSEALKLSIDLSSP